MEYPFKLVGLLSIRHPHTFIDDEIAHREGNDTETLGELFIFSTKYYYVKGKANQLNALISEVTKAWEDDTLTQEEPVQNPELIKQLVTR